MDSVTIMLIPSKKYIAARPNTKEHHLTVAYFGKLSTITRDGISRLQGTVDMIGRFSGGPIPAKANGIGVFNAGADDYAVVDLIDGIGTFRVRARIENLFGAREAGLDGVTVDYTHGFTPHITREYLSAEDYVYAEVHPDMIDDIEFEFTAIGLWYGEHKYEVAL